MEIADRILQLETLLQKVNKRLSDGNYKSRCQQSSDIEQRNRIENKLKKLRKKVISPNPL
jgi:hypothetical protein